jgi:crotonobetainyl-CoA:carnitine CoA-transferase CaiB-like acyl-CoA transferase
VEPAAGSHTHTHIYRVSQEECARLREGVPYVKVHRYNPKHLYPKLNGYGDNGERILKL